jgi:hypothetical protein
VDTSYVFAGQSCSVVNPASGLKIRLSVGEAWAADDPFVKARPDLFLSVPFVVRRSEPLRIADVPVESAVAVPGVKRQVKRA